MKDIEEIKDKQKEVDKKVLEFLKQHRGQGFTREEIAQETGVNKKDVSYEWFADISPLRKWKISREFEEHKPYYYAERVNKFIRPLISGCFLGAGFLVASFAEFTWIGALEIAVARDFWRRFGFNR